MHRFLAFKDVSRKSLKRKKLRSPEVIFDLGSPDPQTVTDCPLCVTPFCRRSRAL